MEKIKKIYKKYQEIINYIIVGGCTTLVSLGSKYLLLFTILNPKNSFELQLSVIISWICSVTFAYITNRIFVFKSKSKQIIQEIISFFSSRILTLLMEMFIMWFFITLLRLNSDNWVIIITLICQLLIMILNYLLSKLFVFRKKNK